MEMTAKINLKQTGRLALTQQLVQSIELLQLSNQELAEKISSELIENPVLEEENTEATEDDKNFLQDIGKELSGDESFFQKRDEKETIFEETESSSAYDSPDDDRKRSYIENVVAQEETLKEHLISQASLVARDQSELFLLEDIITSLDDNGFLNVSQEEIARETSTDIEKVKDAVSIVNNLNPVGCGAGNIKESLIIQAGQIYQEDDILLAILKDYFIELEKLEYGKIASAFGISPAEVIRKSKLIHNLDPYPGLKYSLKKTRYIIPDIEVKLVDNDIIITINDDWIPKIRINSYYRNILKKKTIDKKLTEYLRIKMQSANNLLNSISSRRATIIKVVNAIMEHQREFLVKGTGHLKPLVYSDIAMEVGMHESTVGRVVNNKFAQTPWGVFELKYFFVSKLKSKNMVDHSSDEVMSLIKEVIANEDPRYPVSDEEILKKLQDKGINIARRTIAKYRSILNISSSNMRKKLNIIKAEGKK